VSAVVGKTVGHPTLRAGLLASGASSEKQSNLGSAGIGDPLARLNLEKRLETRLLEMPVARQSFFQTRLFHGDKRGAVRQ